MRVLVIGGSGFVGTTVVPTLQQFGVCVTVLNRGTRSTPGARQLIADRNDRSKMIDLANSIGRYDAVIDTSSYSKDQTAIAWEAFNRKTDRWIHLGSASVYKETQGRLPSEVDAIGGAEVWESYGRDKSDADNFLLEHAQQASVTILRPPYLYGPHNDNDRESFVWSRLLRGRPVLMPGDGQTQLQFLHVQDLANTMYAICKNSPSESTVFNIASPEILTFESWIALLADVSGCINLSFPEGGRATGYKPRQYFPFRNYPCVVDTERISSKSKFSPTIRAREGFESTYRSYSKTDLSSRHIDFTIEDDILGRLTSS
jgi:nucleoside-diphosphate-sugar epimerase